MTSSADIWKVAQNFLADGSQLRVRFGTITSVQSGRTCTVAIGGSLSSVNGVEYLASVVPIPGAKVMLLTDGTDMVVIGTFASANSPLTPRVYRGTNQSIATTTNTLISWSAASDDPLGWWSAGAPTQVNVTLPGRYLAFSNIRWQQSGTGIRISRIFGGGILLGESSNDGAAGIDMQYSTVVVPLVVTTSPVALTNEVQQNSGGALNVVAVGGYTPSLSVIYLG